jgi:hypothetical protein
MANLFLFYVMYNLKYAGVCVDVITELWITYLLGVCKQIYYQNCDLLSCLVGIRM